MYPPDDLDHVEDATALGLSVLAQIVEHAPDGIFLCDAERRWEYVNAAACRMLGRSVEDLLGRDYVDVVPPRDKTASRRHYSILLSGSTEMLTRMLIGAGGEEREMVFAPFRVDIDGHPHGAALFRDVTEARAAARTAAALGQSAAELVGTRSTDEILANVARRAVEGTRATWAGVAMVGEDDTFTFAGAYGPRGPDFGDTSEAVRTLRRAPAHDFLARMTAGSMRAGGAPSRAATLTRGAWERDPILSVFGANVLDNDWQVALSVPLAFDNRVIGALMVLLPASVAAASEAEAAFCTALADHAAVAAANERLSRQASRSAALRERGRVARQLHDSVSQALFAMTMHARAAELAVERAGHGNDTPLARSVRQLSQLARGTSAEMRALIVELRPEALADEGLVGALRTQAAAISAREHVTVVVSGPSARPVLDEDVEAHLYRIVSEALHNVVKHARADHATVTVRVDEQMLRIAVTDDGIGFDPTASYPGHLGLSTMAQRAEAVGAQLEIVSGTGTTVSVAVGIGVAATPPGAVS